MAKEEVMKEAIKNWAVLTGVKALKTFAQALVALFGAGAVNVVTIPWQTDLGIAAGAAVACALHNLTSFPEPKAVAEAEAPAPVAEAPKV